MILIFGGRHDPNIAVLADRLAARGMPFIDLRIGAEANPRLRIDLARQVFEVDGEAVPVTGAFLRHDVFLYPTEDVAGAAASGQPPLAQVVRGVKGRMLHAALRLRATPALSRVTRRIPLRWQTRFKSWLRA